LRKSGRRKQQDAREFPKNVLTPLHTEISLAYRVKIHRIALGCQSEMGAHPHKAGCETGLQDEILPYKTS
jgi:hypothetical protein